MADIANNCGGPHLKEVRCLTIFRVPRTTLTWRLITGFQVGSRMITQAVQNDTRDFKRVFPTKNIAGDDVHVQFDPAPVLPASPPFSIASASTLTELRGCTSTIRLFLSLLR